MFHEPAVLQTAHPRFTNQPFANKVMSAVKIGAGGLQRSLVVKQLCHTDKHTSSVAIAMVSMPVAGPRSSTCPYQCGPVMAFHECGARHGLVKYCVYCILCNVTRSADAQHVV